MEWSVSLLALEKRRLETKKTKIMNRREEISVKMPNQEARMKLTSGDKTKLNEFSGENMGRNVLTVPNGGIL
jgi:ribosomal protein S10